MNEEDLYYKSKAYQNRKNAIQNKKLCAYCGRILSSRSYFHDDLAFCDLSHYEKNRKHAIDDQT